MGYQPLSVCDAAATCIPPDLCRTLRTGAQVNMFMGNLFLSEFKGCIKNGLPANPIIVFLQDELLPVVTCTAVDLSEDEEDKKQEEDDGSDQDLCPTLSFSAPEALLRSPNAHPLRIFVCFFFFTYHDLLRTPCPYYEQSRVIVIK